MLCWGCNTDCCDGSDEQPGKCKNTCKEEGSARRTELKARAKAYALGFGKREGYVKDAVKRKAEWTSELSGLDAQIKTEDASVKKLQGTAQTPPKVQKDTFRRYMALWIRSLPEHIHPWRLNAVLCIIDAKQGSCIQWRVITEPAEIDQESCKYDFGSPWEQLEGKGE